MTPKLSWEELVRLAAVAVAEVYQHPPESVTIRFADRARPITIPVDRIVTVRCLGHVPNGNGSATPLPPTVTPPPPEEPEEDEGTENDSSSAGKAAVDFEPSDFQVMIYHALEYHAYHAEDLAAKVGCDRRSLWKKNGIKELMAIGWIAIDSSEQQLGYFRPDAPPKELRRQPEKVQGTG